jgi:hypothetical protein
MKPIITHINDQQDLIHLLRISMIDICRVIYNQLDIRKAANPVLFEMIKHIQICNVIQSSHWD